MFEFIKNLDTQTIVLIVVAVVAIYLLTRDTSTAKVTPVMQVAGEIPVVPIVPVMQTSVLNEEVMQEKKEGFIGDLVKGLTTSEEVKGVAPVASNLDVASSAGSVAMEKRMADEEIPIKPAYVDGDVRSLMSGSGFIPPHDIIPPWGMSVDSKVGIVDGLDDGAGGSLGLHYSLTSPACCSEQWPVPFKLPYDKFVCENKDKFVANPHMGNNSWQNSGCVCMPKKTHEFLVNRGGNA